ncbi:MAG TPA: thioredoxin-disulfide reductase [Candidatus Cloacimonadota bacterium]|nr:thioredoxin-disulfide reductase [Candidatus Cloacimonadota bacterium]HPT71388.1 thioredoxin-disulfide reductase [Candidatus Cloacimonadota bacterium]
MSDPLNFSLSFSVPVQKEELYDAIIIGGGPAGLTAGLYLARYKLKTLMIEKAITSGGQLATTEWVENYPGFPQPVLGSKLAADMETQAKNFGLQIVREGVTSVDFSKKVKEVRTDHDVYKAKAILITTGASPRKLGLPGEDEYHGRGVSYCATCDGPFYPDKLLAVVGGGNSALQESLFLARYARELTIIHRRDKFTAEPLLIEKAKANPKIKIQMNKQVTGLDFSNAEERKLILEDVNTSEKSELRVDGLFIFIGEKPNTALFKDILDLKGEFLVTDAHHRTNVEGVYAAGDVEVKEVRQVATAVGDGCEAAHWINEYVENWTE